MANKTNTVAKGDAFENRVFVKIKELVELGYFGINSERSFVYQKKAYNAKSGRKIIFDIVIETYMPNATEPFLLTLIECKDYNNSISVEKISKLAYDISDVGGHKGIFITTSKFQKGALNVARAEKIGLAVMNDTNDLAWKVQRIGKRHYQIRQEIEDYISDAENMNKYPFLAVSGYSYYTSLIDFVSEIVEQELKLPFSIPYLTPEEIEAIISNTFKQKNRNDLRYRMKTEELVDFAKNKLKVNLIFDNVLEDEIGHCDFQNNTISISNTMSYGSSRWRFTFAHEIGHYILHRYLYEKYGVSMANDDESNIALSGLSDNLTKRLEIQANIFATKILIPDEALKVNYYLLHQEELALPRYPQLYVDRQPCNIDDYYYITGKIANHFNVSREVVKNKLLEFGYLVQKNPAI
ncbi:MAG: ImmA/IrrE family metallo-endopeptidase [Bacteroidales bacterium]|nr:ImmA/IrrE family metallo-endopeptidase [Bacteroidales bacterium]